MKIRRSAEDLMRIDRWLDRFHDERPFLFRLWCFGIALVIFAFAAWIFNF